MLKKDTIIINDLNMMMMMILNKRANNICYPEIQMWVDVLFWLTKILSFKIPALEYSLSSSYYACLTARTMLDCLCISQLQHQTGVPVSTEDSN